MQEEDINRAKAAMDRLSGCDLSHLSMAEAKVIQAFRDNKYTDAELLRLVLILVEDGPASWQIRSLLKDLKA